MPELPTEIDTSRPHPARTYDHFLGGKNNFAADREVADKVLAGWPAIRTGVRENRKFLARVVRNDEPGPRPTPADVSAYGGVARKP